MCSGKDKIISVEHDEEWTNEGQSSQSCPARVSCYSISIAQVLATFLAHCSQRQSPPVAGRSQPRVQVESLDF